MTDVRMSVDRISLGRLSSEDHLGLGSVMQTTPLFCRFFVTGGHKFGGDFLAYQGDPSCFHAQFCVRVLHSMDGARPW